MISTQIGLVLVLIYGKISLDMHYVQCATYFKVNEVNT